MVGQDTSIYCARATIVYFLVSCAALASSVIDWMALSASQSISFQLDENDAREITIVIFDRGPGEIPGPHGYQDIVL